MKRLLLLALPALLAGCPKPQAGNTARPAVRLTSDAKTAQPAAAPAPAATAQPAVEFGDPGMARAAGMLSKFRWQLASAVDARGQRIDALLVRPARPVTLTFRGAVVEIDNACNQARGSYALGGKAVTIGKLAATGKACTDAGLMALDAEVGKRLAGKLGLRMSKGDARRLELTNALGDVLVFAAAESPASAGGG